MPSKTDNARAWCALIGVSAFPTRVSTGGGDMGRDGTAALFQLKGPIRFAVLPVFSGWWTLAKYRAVVRSAALAKFGIQKARPSEDSELVSPESEWLREKGTAACAVFNQYVSDNKSAPERWLERGQLYSTRPVA